MNREHLLEPPERVLSTLNPDGTRRWLRPKAAFGRWWRRRRVVAWTLMVLFTAVPWIEVGGRPLLRLDVANRDFTILFTTFRPTDSLLLALLLLAIFVGIFLVSALVGRAWCGWACPQTVYLEFLFRPIERWIEGVHAGRARKEVPAWRRALKWTAFTALALHLANTFLSYFAGPRTVLDWSFGSPAEHPVAFAVVAVTTGLVLFDFGVFREQMCTLVCPYARLQSVLLDRDSLIVGYDERRGEPRGPMRRGREDETGDCIDCSLCVAACPTGIDIRDGLQLECVACTQCIDACDAVMDKIGRPRGLIRYDSQNVLERRPARRLRPRVVAYPAILLVLLGGLGAMLGARESAEVNLLRVQDTPYALLEDGRVQNVVSLRIENRAGETRRYEVAAEPPATVLAPQFPLAIPAGESRTVNLPVRTPLSAFDDGSYVVRLRVSDGVDYDRLHQQPVAGPLEREDAREPAGDGGARGEDSP